MNIPFFDLKRQIQKLYSELEQAVKSVYERGVFIAGETVSDFERKFADYLGAKYCITCANGTDALELILEAYGIGKGDEVIVPAFGWASPYNAVKRAGATPVLVDVEPNTGNIDVEVISGKISQKTKAVIPIHLHGNPCEIKKLLQICQKAGVLLIEDCAQAHGASVNGKKVGTFGDAAIFSFYPTKNLGCLGDGGAVVTDDEAVCHKLRELRDYGRTDRHTFHAIGRNSRMDEVQAAILSVKLKYLDAWNLKRKEIARRYWTSLKSDLKLFSHDSVFYQFTVRSEDRKSLGAHLAEKGIGTDIHYPFTISSAYGLDEGPFSNARLLSKQIMSLPIYPELTESEISYICEQLALLEDFIL